MLKYVLLSFLAICYKNAKERERCIDCYVKAADCQEKHGQYPFYPTALKRCRGIVFTHGVRWVFGQAGGGK